MSWLQKIAEAFCPKCNWEVFGEECSNPNCEGASKGGVMDDPQLQPQQRELPSDAVYDQIGEERPSFGDRLHEQKGVWLYPFNQVKQDAGQGWYLDWFDEQGSMSDLSKVNPGDQVADKALNLTPYWEVSYVDENSGRIYVNPIEPNPFISGVGAGGKEIDDHDMQVFSGEYEKERIDGVLKDISNGRYANPKDVAYILLGTVPVNMGPNGAQGGWYNLMDHYSNRGGQQGMTAEEMMMQDAASLKKLGFAVPQSALEGTLSPNLFDYVIEGGLPNREEEAAQLRLPGEDFQDVNAMAHFILTHPQPSIKMRNWEALTKMYYKAAPYNDEPRNPALAQQIAAAVKPVAEQMSKMYHQKQEQFGDYDQYEYLKEQVIHFAERQGWMDVVQSFENSLDPDTRKVVLNSYANADMTNDVYRLLMEETDPRPLQAGLYTLYKAGLKSNNIIDADPQKYLSILSHMKENTAAGYYAKELAGTDIWLQNKADVGDMGMWIAREKGVLTTVEKYLKSPRQAARSSWLQRLAEEVES